MRRLKVGLIRILINILLYIFYDELKQTKLRYCPNVPVTSLIANVGGTLGLFLGMSFLSFTELFEILFQSLVILRQRSIGKIEEVY